MFRQQQQQQLQYQQQQQAQMAATLLEMESMAEMYSQMSNTCFRKCMPGPSATAFKETELNVGEMSCVDRCVSKYMEAHEKIGLKMQEIQQQQMQMQQQSQQPR